MSDELGMPERIVAYSNEHSSPGMGSTFHMGWHNVEDPGLAPAGIVEDNYVRADLYDTVTAERDTAKEIIKELVSKMELIDKEAGLTYTEHELLARAKELLK